MNGKDAVYRTWWFSICNIDGHEIAEAEGVVAAKAAARHLLESGEEPGPLELYPGDREYPLVRAELDEHRKTVWHY